MLPLLVLTNQSASEGIPAHRGAFMQRLEALKRESDPLYVVQDRPIRQ